MTHQSSHVHYLGIDVAKQQLDLAAVPPIRDLPAQIDNQANAIKRWLQTLPAGTRLVCEATGPYHKALLQTCWQPGITVSLVNPEQVRHFAKSRRRFAKTDKLDAALLAAFAACEQPHPTPPPDPVRQQLQELNTRRSQLVAVRAAELKRQQQPTLGKHATASLRRSITALTREINLLETAAAKLIDRSPVLSHQRAVLCQVEGVGSQTATALLATLPELGTVSGPRLAALAGLAPYARQSGTLKGRAHIRGGRVAVRQALYMAAFSAMRCNPHLQPFAKRLAANGKHYLVVITAVMRKLLLHLNARLAKHPFVQNVEMKA